MGLQSQKDLKSDFYLLAKCKTFKTFCLRRRDEKTKSISYAKTSKNVFPFTLFPVIFNHSLHLVGSVVQNVIVT